MERKRTKAEGIDIFHEILFALTGIKSAFSSYQFALKELFQLSEVILLEKILNLGEDYKYIKKYIDSIKGRQFNKEDEVGLYLLSFAEHLNRTLDQYVDDIIQLEEEILTQPHNSLHIVWSKMHRHKELLFGLTALVKLMDFGLINQQRMSEKALNLNGVVGQNSRGCIVLEHLHQMLLSDVGVTRSAAALILDGMNEIFFRHLCCWLLYGDLVDSYKEFFIQQSPDTDEKNTPFEKYSLNFSMLPNHIEVPLAEKILRVGQTVLFLRSNPYDSSKKNVVEELETRDEICIDLGGFFGEKEKEIQEKLMGMRQVCQWNENGEMEKLVSKISSYVTTQLWTLAVQDAKLLDQLHVVNDFFLLGRGELFHEFVTQADQYLSKPVFGALDLNLLLQESARKVLMKEESLQRFSLEVLESSSETNEDGLETLWNCIEVKYDAPWPLQLLFTNEALKSYNKIFRFLLRLKKVEVDLGRFWLVEKSIRYKQDDIKIRQLHRNLFFLLKNLQYYVHVDVLNSQFVTLKNVIETSKDFDRVQRAHNVFLENLSCQLFLGVESEEKTKNPIKRSINKLVELCEEYCGEVEVTANYEKMVCMLTRFEAFVEFLLNHLTRITNQAIHPSSQHLLQFLLRLDFNCFFSEQFSSTLESMYF